MQDGKTTPAGRRLYLIGAAARSGRIFGLFERFPLRTVGGRSWLPGCCLASVRDSLHAECRSHRSPLRACADRRPLDRSTRSMPVGPRAPRGMARSRHMSQSSSLRDKRPQTCTLAGHDRLASRHARLILGKIPPRLGRGMSFADHDVSLLAFSRSNRSWRAGGDTPPARWAHRSQWVSTTRLSWLRQSACVGLDVRDRP